MQVYLDGKITFKVEWSMSETITPETLAQRNPFVFVVDGTLELAQEI